MVLKLYNFTEITIWKFQSSKFKPQIVFKGKYASANVVVLFYSVLYLI